jgi:hypothetical protein
MDHQFFLNQLIVEQEKETYSNKTNLFIQKIRRLVFFIQAFFLVLLQANLVRRYELYPQDI